MIMLDLLAAAIFLALFYLLVNPSKVRVRMNLMVAWFIFIGAMAVTLLAAINEGFRKWISAIQMTALAVSVFFMLIAVEPGAQPNLGGTTYPPQPPTPPTQ
jgi:hypothetical protein